MVQRKEKLPVLQAIAKVCFDNPLETALVLLSIYMAFNMNTCAGKEQKKLAFIEHSLHQGR